MNTSYDRGEAPAIAGSSSGRQGECMIVDPTGGDRLLFIEVDDLQEPVGRVHLDLAPTDRSRDDEVERVLALGARQVADRRNADGTGWVVLADPRTSCWWTR